MKSRYSIVLLAAGLTTLLSGCMTVKPDDPVYIRQQQLEARVDRLDQVFNNRSLVNLSQNVDNLQQQLNELRGDVQVLQHDQQLSKKQQRDLYS
ncbi:MAG: YbgF trimerization domain-containing protein, partial [Gammaproteobacteria bacterium]